VRVRERIRVRVYMRRGSLRNKKCTQFTNGVVTIVSKHVVLFIDLLVDRRVHGAQIKAYGKWRETLRVLSVRPPVFFYRLKE